MKLKTWLPVRRQENRGGLEQGRGDHPLVAFHREVNRMFDDFFNGFALSPFRFGDASAFVPRVNVVETENEVRVSAELPGLDEKDVEVSLARGGLTIKGEKKEEQGEKGHDYYCLERTSGAFQREIPLPDGVDIERSEATFKKGVLSVVLPKRPDAQPERKRIAIKGA